MSLRNEVPDGTILKQVIQRLGRCGTGSQSHVTATVRGGDVTLSGTLQYERERNTIIKSTNNVSGIRRVIDQMSVTPVKRVNG